MTMVRSCAESSVMNTALALEACGRTMSRILSRPPGVSSGRICASKRPSASYLAQRGVGEGVDLAILVAEFVPHNVEGKDFGVRNAIERE